MSESSDAIRSLANLLRARKSKPKEPSYVLVLGAGASIRSGSPSLAKVVSQVIEQHGNRKVLSRSGEEQIEEFYRIVDGLDDQSLWLVLDELFKGAQPSPGYEYLARLVGHGYLDIILSTNVDTLVEKALEREGLSLVDDVDVIDAGGVKTDAEAGPIIGRLENPTPQIKLVKLHGHLPTRQLKFRPKAMFRFPDRLAKAIEGYVSGRLRSVIVVGHSMRDEDLNNCFRGEGGAIWYVNPSIPSTSDFAGKMMASRQGSQYIDGEYGDFDRFFVKLFRSALRLTPAAEIPTSVRFLNRWEEIRDLKTRLSLPRHPPVTVVSGPMGYGKTYLLRQAASDLKGDGWDCALLECEGFASQDTEAVLTALSYAFGCYEAADWEQIGSCLGRKITDQRPSYRVALLVDGIGWLPGSMRRQVLMGVNTIYECVREARGECRVVLSGRCVRDDLDWMTEEISGEGSLPFGQPGMWYTEIPLSEFDQDVIIELIRRVSRRDFMRWEYDVMSSSLLEITGGHPKGLVDIVTKHLNRRGWTFGKKPGTRRFYFTPETKEMLFTACMTDVVNEIRVKIGKLWWENFQTVCILRRLNASVLKYLIDRGAIRQSAKGEEVLGWLVRHNLVREKQAGMWGDAIARRVVVAEMKMVAQNRERYVKLNRIAADSFAESLDKMCKIYETIPLPELESPLITYGIELMYHWLESAKCLPPEQRPENPLEAILAEVCAKLIPLGDGIVQKFVEQVTQDKEICPSEEAKNVVASSLGRHSE